MGMIINIDKALELRSDYNILKEPLHAMMRNQQEAWEKENPIDLIFARGSLGGFQETYTSSIGFAHAFKETSDYAVGPIFNTAEGFAATYRTRTFQGGFIISQQVLEDGQMGKVKDDASAFVKRWHGDIVEYAMKSLEGGFGDTVTAGIGTFEGSKLVLKSADTVDGDITTESKNPLFCKTHKTVKREDTAVINQSNMYYAGIDTSTDDGLVVAKLADAINQVITNMENCKDDNGKYAGVMGEKTIVAANDAHLKGLLNMAVSMDMLGGEINPAYKRATVKTTPYLRDIAPCANGIGFFIVDKSYNAENHGLELTERIPFTLDAFENKQAPRGIKYEGRQRFDINVATWRGIAYVYVGTPAGAAGAWNEVAKYTQLAIKTFAAKYVANKVVQ